VGVVRCIEGSRLAFALLSAGPSPDAGPTRVQPTPHGHHRRTDQAFTSSRRVAADHSTAGVSIPPALLAGSPPAAPLPESSGGRDPLARGLVPSSWVGKQPSLARFNQTQILLPVHSVFALGMCAANPICPFMARLGSSSPAREIDTGWH